ncbi:DNA cytosine methyltransferase [Pectobacterium carotovorum subsp. carotovorum]|nr:DNA cytosine methyltransferase [Pectobacterium carotovorum]MCL6366212.1 DNA cytosine methyltransferase [Pectobacterium carotovorum subsp. carotovorum]
MKEIIVDNFAGGGGASTGIEMAIGRSVDIAINHDLNAIAMHTTNHPDTLHYCENVFDIDPVAATAGRPVGLVWFSPDCRHFSKAKGSKPVKKEIRGLAWIVLRWGLDTDFRVGMLENVGEFKTWGPLLTAEDGTQHPDPERAGETFDAFVGMLTTGIAINHPALIECCEALGIDIHGEDAKRLSAGLGYTVDYRELRACDYGAPTIRKRFFMVMRRDGKPVTWPEATHGDPKSPAVQAGKLKPWRTAADCIVWSITSTSIFERKKPLATNTLRRVAKGLWRHVLTNAEPFIVGAGGPEYSGKPVAINQPFGTIVSENHRAVVTPILTPFINEHANASNQRTMPIDEPMRTLCAQVKGGHFSVVAPIMIPLRGTNEHQLFGHSIERPLSTVTASGAHHALIAASLVDMGHGESADFLSPELRDKARRCADLLHSHLPEHFSEPAEMVLMSYRGIWWVLVDITLRMLQASELYAAQGFPDWYVIDIDYRGVRHTKTAQVARCGNAVPPQFSEALVRANLPEMCAEQEGVAA